MNYELKKEWASEKGEYFGGHKGKTKDTHSLGGKK